MTQKNEWHLCNLLDYLQSGFTVMLILGALASELNVPQLAIGFIPTLLIVAGVRELTPWGLYHPSVYLMSDQDKESTLFKDKK